jgi:enamine deaminase RidA (YjgF/YER057c/UK114 family)
MSAEDNLQAMGLTLPATPKPTANYKPYKKIGDLVFLSGNDPRYPDGSLAKGKVGRDVAVEQAYEHAKLVGLGLLSVAKAAAGSLDKVEMVKVLGMVNAMPEFTQSPHVINGCSDLFVAVLGDNGRHACSAIGVNSLPENITVEIEVVIRVLP